MLCLSVKQPWAELIVGGRKSIELRTWPTRQRAGQLVAIHTGKTLAKGAPPEVWEAFRSLNAVYPGCGAYVQARRGGIIGVARYAGCIPYGAAAWGEDQWRSDAGKHLAPLDWCSEESVGFRFDRPVRFDQIIPCRGRLGFYQLAPEVEQCVRSALRLLLERHGLRDDDGTRTVTAEGQAVASALAMLGDPVRVAGGVR